MVGNRVEEVWDGPSFTRTRVWTSGATRSERNHLTKVLDPHCLRIPVQLTIHIGIAHDRLYVFARFGEWNGFHEFLDIAIFPG